MKIISLEPGEAAAQLHRLNQIFEIARFVDPVKNRIYSFKDGEICITEGVCHEVWNRGQRCENCVSSKAFSTRGQAFKVEFMNDRVFLVIATYCEVGDTPCVLELVIKMSDELLSDAFGSTESFAAMVINAGRNIYQDALTCARNRRYYDEQMSMFNADAAVVAELRFKDGCTPDRRKALLSELADVLHSCIRRRDVLARIEDNTFVVGCLDMRSEDDLKGMLRRLQDSIKHEFQDLDSELSIALAGCYGPGTMEDLVPAARVAVEECADKRDLMIVRSLPQA